MPTRRSFEYTAYIAQDSERHARDWLAKVWQTIFSLAEDPKCFAVIAEAVENMAVVIK